MAQFGLPGKTLKMIKYISKVNLSSTRKRSICVLSLTFVNCFARQLSPWKRFTKNTWLIKAQAVPPVVLQREHKTQPCLSPI